jgi:hypothetical protein
MIRMTRHGVAATWRPAPIEQARQFSALCFRHGSLAPLDVDIELTEWADRIERAGHPEAAARLRALLDSE